MVLFSTDSLPMKRERTLLVIQLAALSIMKGIPSVSNEMGSTSCCTPALLVANATLGTLLGTRWEMFDVPLCATGPTPVEISSGGDLPLVWTVPSLWWRRPARPWLALLAFGVGGGLFWAE